MRLSGYLVATALVAATTAASVGRNDGEAREVARIRTHFDSVLTALPARDVSALPAAQRSNRAALMATLRAYRERGVFPHNYDFPGQDVPYFVDRKTGTVCAVGHLLESTGRRDIVDRVAATNNNVRVKELAGDTAFTSWLSEQGLTLDEAAFIQMPYRSGPSQATIIGYAVAAPIALGGVTISSLYNAWGNRDGHSAFGRRAGMSFGLLTAGVGAGVMMQGAPKSIGMSAIAVGGTSALLAMRSMRKHGEIVAREESVRKRVATVSPTVSPDGAGLSVSLKF
jgi:hypothetical protein